MTYESHALIVQDRNCQLLYNPKLLTPPSAGFIKEGILEQSGHYEQITSGGRGQAWFIEFNGLALVLRAYQRGGLVARFNRQTYTGFSMQGSRAFKEWRLLEWMVNQGLPVPKPVAASVCRWPVKLSPFYRAHILVERITGALTLDQVLSDSQLDIPIWKSIGHCIRCFHDAGVYHADLNANNIMLDASQRVYLIDFDKGEVRPEQTDNARWKTDNLQRLKRSLLKQQTALNVYYYSSSDWDSLIEGYSQSPAD